MSIDILCLQCRAQLRVKDELAGRRGKCPKCQTVFLVPAAVAALPAEAELRLADDDPAPAPIIPRRRPATADRSVTSRQTPSAACETPTSSIAVPPTPALPVAAPPIAAPPISAPLIATSSLADSPPQIRLDSDFESSASLLNLASTQSPVENRFPLPPRPQISAEQRGQILEALQGSIAPVKATAVYRMAMLFVALVMLLLPVIYLGLIAGVAYLMYYHAIHHTGIMQGKVSGRGQLILLAIYLAPLFAGVIMIAFMVKPLFARREKAEKPRSLTPEGEPLLFAFVERLSALVGAPKPKRIDVNSEVNASASLRRGLLSVLEGNDLVLTIGLPLAAGLNLQQFAGVLAHEFGHFTQGWGMRLTYLIRSINFWFLRVVYERDEWDQQLVAWCNSGDYRVSIVVNLARGCVWLSRKVLWVLMMAGNAVCGVLLREMEFDADLYEMRMVGSPAFESTCRRLRVLGVATQLSYADLQRWHQEGRLGDNLSRLIVANIERLPAELIAELNKSIEESTATLFDSHPSDRDRINQAREEGTPGIFHDSRPATELFSDFDALSKTLTIDFYRAVIGPEVKLTDLQAVGQLITRQQRENEAFKALGRYFQNALRPLRPLPLESGCANPPLDAKLWLKQLQRSRQTMLAAVEDYRKAFLDFDKIDSHAIEAEQAAALLRANFKIKSSMFKRPLTGTADIRKSLSANNDQLNLVLPRLQAFEKAAALRVQTAVELLQVPQIIAKLPDGEALRQRTDGVLLATFVLGQAIPSLIKLRNVHNCVGLLFAQLEPNTQSDKLVSTIKAEVKQLHTLIVEIRDALMLVPYPLEHGHGDMSIAAYCSETTPPEADLEAIVAASSEMLDRLPTLLMRMMAHLAEAAEQVEKAVGLPPLEEPKEDKFANPEKVTDSNQV